MAPNTKVAIARPNLSSTITTSNVRTHVNLGQLKHSSYNERLRTFTNRWPVSFLQPQKLSEAGFYYTGHTDIVRCFTCAVTIGKWEASDDPVADHIKWSPDCTFANGKLENDNYGTYTAVPGVVPVKRPAYAQYASFEKRLETFADWPVSIIARPMNLAEAGFFYSGKGDQTLCFQCGAGLKEWESTDIPWEQHSKWFPKCPFVVQQKGIEYIAEQQHQKQSPNAASLSKPAKVEEVKEPANSTPDNLLCKICLSNEVAIVFLPCGHMVACVECAPQLPDCAICRKRVEAYVRAFLS